MRIARIAAEIAAVLAAAAATLIAIILTLSIGMVPHTVSNGSEIESAFLQAKEYVEKNIKSTGRAPTKSEFYKWRSDKGRWISRIDIEKPPTGNVELQKQFGKLPAETYVLSVWRGEWSEYFVQGKGSTVDSAFVLYSGFIGLALGAYILSAALWLVARKLKRRNASAPQ